MENVKDGKTYYLKEDRRKVLKVVCRDGDEIGLMPNIIYPKYGEKVILPNNQLYWTTEKDLLEGGLYVTL